jgi:hypothetical protein
MEKTRLSEGQMMKVLREADQGTIAEVAAKPAIGTQTLNPSRLQREGVHATGSKTYRARRCDEAQRGSRAAPMTRMLFSETRSGPSPEEPDPKQPAVRNDPQVTPPLRSTLNWSNLCWSNLCCGGVTTEISH